MNPVLATLLPDALVMAAGAALRRVVPPAAWEGMDRLNYHILFPALIFQAAASRAPGAGDVAVIGTGVWAVLFLGFALGWLLRPLGPPAFLDFAGVWQMAWRFNSALALVLVQALPAGAQGLMPLVIALGVPLSNALAVAAMSRGRAISPWRTLGIVLVNPFVLASLLGIAVAVTGLPVPQLVSDVLSRLARAALPIALLSIGASLDLRSLVRLTPFLAALNAIKLLVLPATAWAAGHALALPADQAAVLVLFAALPTASAAHVLASVFGADRSLAATVVAQSTLLACLTATLWIALLAG